MARPADRHSLIGAVRALAIALLLCCAIAPASRADPFTGGGAAPEASAGTTIAPWGHFVMRLADAQGRLNDAISDAFERVRDTHSHTAIALILGLAFLYGVLHALGPGHGKAVVASYFLANHSRWTNGIVMGSVISFIQGLTAILLVGLLAIVLQWRQFDVLNRSTLVEFVSYALIAALGLVMLYRAITGQGCAHDHGVAPGHPHDHDHDHLPGAAMTGAGAAALDMRLVVATGLTPCASAIIILLFALANQALTVGIAAVGALAIGMAMTVSLIGIASILGRRALLRVLDTAGVESHRFERALSILGALVIIGASGLLMAGAWFRL
jgi:ABC-type nickel/cobalt efflux system permease component RcnA